MQYTFVILCSSVCSIVPETSSQGFDPSDFPLLSLARSRQECSGGLVTNSSALPSRSMYGKCTCTDKTERSHHGNCELLALAWSAIYSELVSLLVTCA